MKRWGKWARNGIAGVLIGGGAILPGISGGVLAVAFGVYRPLMELLSHPIKAIRKYWNLFIPVGIGAAAGFWLFSLLASLFFDNEPAPATCLFVGLIAGTLPGLYRAANDVPEASDVNPPETDADAAAARRNKRNAWIAGACAFAVLTGILLVLKLLPETQSSITPNIWWYLFCGAVWGLSLIVPGLSSSSILIFLGLYQDMTRGIKDLNFAVIIPVAVGIIGMAIALGKGIDTLFRRHYRVCSYAVMGLVVASTVAIIPLAYDGWLQGGLCLLLAVAGFFAAFWMDRLSDKFGRDAG